MDRKYHLVLECIINPIALTFGIICLWVLAGWLISFLLGFINSEAANFIRNLAYKYPILSLIIILIGIIVGLITAVLNYNERCNIDTANKKLNENPENVEALLQKAAAFRKIFTFYGEKKRKIESKTCYEKVLLLDPTNVSALSGLEKLLNSK